MQSTTLTGQFLIAMPTLMDPRFAHGVVYMCSHNETGAMGLVVNRLYGAIDIKGLLDQLNISVGSETPDLPVHYGGPVETGRGFILHTDDFLQDTSMRIDGDIALTATMDVLKAISTGNGPEKCLVILGYAGWGPGQLEQEITQGSWLNGPVDTELLFNPDLDVKWERAIAKLGFNPALLSTEMGHA